MYRPFARVAMVLAVLICMITVHGVHSDDTGGHLDSEVAVVSAMADHYIGDMVALSLRPTSASDASAGAAGHEPHGDSCDTASGLIRAVAVVAPLTAVTITPQTGIAGGTPVVDSAVVRGGRELLLVRCLHRT